MKYTQKSFSVPVASPKVSQEQWDAIWNAPTIEEFKRLFEPIKFPMLNKVQVIRKPSKG